MPLIIYFFISLIFFKAFPLFLIGAPNSLAGALMMSISSTLILLLTMIRINLRAIAWLDSRSTGLERASFIECVFPHILISILAFSVIGFFIAVGFSPSIIKALTGYRGDGIVWLFPILFIPPLCYLVLIVGLIERVERQMRSISQHKK